MLNVINGTAIVFNDGYVVAAEYQETFPYAALNCELADACDDYE